MSPLGCSRRFELTRPQCNVLAGRLRFRARAPSKSPPAVAISWRAVRRNPTRDSSSTALASGLDRSLQPKASQRFAKIVDWLERRIGHGAIKVVSQIVLTAPAQVRNGLPLVK